DGWVAGLVNAYPAETVAIYKLIRAGRYEEARAIHRWFLPLLELDIDALLVQQIKLTAALTGIGTEDVRLPRMPLEGEPRARVIHLVDAARVNRPALRTDF